MRQTTTTFLALWRMARPLIMTSVILVYILGSLIARAGGYVFDEQAFAWGLGALLLAAASIHYANEYADYETDSLTQPTRFSGGSGVLPGGVVPRFLAIEAAWVTLGLCAAATLIAFVIGVFSWAAMFVLALGTFGGWMYSLPPLALAWRGWGEVDNAVLGGIVLPLYGYVVQAGRIDWQVIAGCAPFALLVFINLLATTWADRRADASVGKYTLATRWSATRLRVVYGLAALLSFALLPLLAGWILPLAIVISGLPAIPVVMWGFYHYTRTEFPGPTVYAMIALLVGQMGAWYAVGF